MNEEWWGICAKGPPDAPRPLRPLPARRLLRAAAGVHARPLRAGHRPRRHPRPLRGDRARRPRRSRRAATRRSLVAADARARAALRAAAAVRDLSAPAARSITHAERRAAGHDAAGVPGLRPARSRSTSTSQAQPGRERDRHASRSTCSATCRTNPIDEIFYENRGRAADRPGRQRDLRAERASSGSRSTTPPSPGTTAGSCWTASTAPATSTGATRATSSASTARPTTARTSTSTTARRRSASRWPASGRCAGLKVAFGPQLWWGANPAFLVKYRRQVGRFDADRRLPRTTSPRRPR